MKGLQEPRLSSYPEYDSEEISRDILAFADTLVDKQGDPIQPMPFQRNILSRACRTNLDGKWSAFEFCLLLARQNGKSWSGHVRVLYGLFKLKEDIVYSAHLFPTTKKMFLEIESLVRANHALFSRLKGYKPGMSRDDPIAGIRYANGSMSIVTKWGNTIDFVARSKGNARGYSVDFVAFEEAFALTSEHIDAQIPTLAGNSVEGNPTVWYISSAPLPESEVLHGIRNRGIAGDDASLLFMEWSAPETTSEDELLEPEVISQANPAYKYRLSHKHVVKEFSSMSVQGYKTERLGIPQFTSSNKVFNSQHWDSLELDPSSEAIDPSNLVLTVDASPDRRYATIMAAYTLGDKTILEIIDRREGVQWVPLRLKELAPRKAYPIIYDEKSHIGSLADQLRILGVPIRAVTFDELLRATGLFFDAVNNSRVNHIGQEELTDAITTTVTKPVGTRWRFVPTTHDISPLVAGLISYYFLNLFETYSSRKKEKAQGQTPKKRRVRV